jgi:hypothetical protein
MGQVQESKKKLTADDSDFRLNNKTLCLYIVLLVDRRSNYSLATTCTDKSLSILDSTVLQLFMYLLLDSGLY